MAIRMLLQNRLNELGSNTPLEAWYRINKTYKDYFDYDKFYEDLEGKKIDVLPRIDYIMNSDEYDHYLNKFKTLITPYLKVQDVNWDHLFMDILIVILNKPKNRGGINFGFNSQA